MVRKAFLEDSWQRQNENLTLRIEEVKIKQEQKFKYLRIILTEAGKSDTDIQRLIVRCLTKSKQSVKK